MYDLQQLQRHLESQWQTKGRSLKWKQGPTEKLPGAFRVLEFEPSSIHPFWIYSTLGMSLERADSHLIEMHIFSAKQDERLVELLTVTASCHRNSLPLGLHHTINFGRPWQDNSPCSFGFISIPYLDGEDLELFHFEDRHLHNLWLIPITEPEREYKVAHGWDALETLFEKYGLDYLDASRVSCV